MVDRLHVTPGQLIVKQLDSTHDSRAQVLSGDLREVNEKSVSPDRFVQEEQTKDADVAQRFAEMELELQESKAALLNAKKEKNELAAIIEDLRHQVADILQARMAMGVNADEADDASSAKLVSFCPPWRAVSP